MSALPFYGPDRERQSAFTMQGPLPVQANASNVSFHPTDFINCVQNAQTPLVALRDANGNNPLMSYVLPSHDRVVIGVSGSTRFTDTVAPESADVGTYFHFLASPIETAGGTMHYTNLADLKLGDGGGMYYKQANCQPRKTETGSDPIWFADFEYRDISIVNNTDKPVALIPGFGLKDFTAGLLNGILFLVRFSFNRFLRYALDNIISDAIVTNVTGSVLKTRSTVESPSTSIPMGFTLV